MQPDDSEDLSASDSEGDDGDYGGVDVDMRPEGVPEDEMDVDAVLRPMAQHVVSLAHLGANS